MYAYEKLMQEHGLTLDQLPQDAKIGITEIKKVQTSFKMSESRGKKPGAAALSKIKAMDKWVVSEIIDFIDETDENKDELPYEAEDVIGDEGKGGAQQAQSKGKDGQVNQDKEMGIAIEKELEALFLAGKTTLNADDIKSSAKTAYKLIFDTYEDGEKNGIITNKYSLLETETEGEFKLTKK